MPNPQLTWEQSAITILTTPGDNVECMAALAALVTASSDWDVEAGGDGVTDDYLEIAGAAAGPNPAARVFIGANPTAGANQPHNNNMGIENGVTAVNDDFWVAYSVDDGRTANPWNSSLPLYTTASWWTGMMLCAINSAATPVDRVKMWSNEEQLVVMFGTSETVWHGFMAGALVLPTREADGESDGRVRGLWCQYGVLATTFWISTAPPFNNASSASNAPGKAVLFDPAESNPYVMKVLTSINFAATNQTNEAGDALGEVHRAPVVISSTIAGAGQTGLNVPNLSPRAVGPPTGGVVFGVWRQIRQGPDRVGDLAITNPPPPTNVVSYTLGASPLLANDTMYLDNQ